MESLRMGVCASSRSLSSSVLQLNHRMYTALMEQSKALLKPHQSQMYFEVHENYANEVQDLSKEHGFTAEIRLDLAGKDRFVICTHNQS